MGGWSGGVGGDTPHCNILTFHVIVKQKAFAGFLLQILIEFKFLSISINITYQLVLILYLKP